MSVSRDPDFIAITTIISRDTPEQIVNVHGVRRTTKACLVYFKLKYRISMFGLNEEYRFKKLLDFVADKSKKLYPELWI